MDVPRIHFRGKFRADVNSRNNCPCNFDVNKKVDSGQEWNYNGTSEFEFLNTKISSVISDNAQSNIIFEGAEIFSNVEKPLAKIVDLDVDFQFTTIYGLKFGIRANGDTLLTGDWSIAIIVRDMWYKLKCAKKGELKHHDALYATISTTTITNIKWSDRAQDLQRATQCATCTGDLAISLSLSYYSERAFTIGDIIGTIGIAKHGEPLNVGGARKLETTKPRLDFEGDHMCTRDGVEIAENEQWTNVAPFMVDTLRNKLVVDLSNAFPVDVNGHVLDIGELWFGVLNTGKGEDSVTIFGEEIPYKGMDILNTGGVVEQSIDLQAVPLENSLLVVVKEVDSDASGDNIVSINEAFPSLKTVKRKGLLVLRELLYFVRPTGYYMDRLEYKNSNKDSSDMTLLVTSYGKPIKNAEVKVEVTSVLPQSTIPAGGVIALENAHTTDSQGLAKFTFKAHSSIPFPRQYSTDDRCIIGDCPEHASEDDSSNDPRPDTVFELPIDGQVYHFCYYVAHDSAQGDGCAQNPKIFSEILSFLSFSTVSYKQPYTWVDHVQPIFKQVYHLHYIMRTILDLSNYTEVTLPHNIKLLKTSLSLDESDANYMPVTRDLSPTKKNMILTWLDKPCYTKDNCDSSGIYFAQPICQTPPSPTRAIPIPSYFKPPRCLALTIPFNTDPDQSEPYFREIFQGESFRRQAENPPRPLFGYESDEERKEKENIERDRSLTFPWFPVCSVDSLKQQLRIAIQIEFSTLPLYLTSLYSIMEDCNVEAYSLVRNIVMQEMLHLAQVANILIAMGEIDSPDVVPKYPIEKLPGGVLPSLRLELKKFSLEHVYFNFMALEVPTLTFVPKPQGHLNTIGQFYREIQLCLIVLQHDDLFPNPMPEKQLEWPWGTQSDIGELFKVTDFSSAQQAISQIVEQGEGASASNPIDPSTGQSAHFFRFEEIVCQHKLKYTENGYSYSGDPIPFNPAGVWPMRENPSKENIIEGSECETQAKAFHRVYRNFLHVMQDMFNGQPEKMQEAVVLMESLQVHAKKVIWTPFDSTTTCGPIWDYEWDD